MITIVVPLPYVTESSNSAVNYVSLPPIVDCPTNPQTPFVSNLGDSWNCNLCAGDNPYFIPFERGDILYFQTSLPDRKNPNLNSLIAGWGQSTSVGLAFTYVRAEMWDCEGTTLLFGDIDLFAVDFWVGFSAFIGSIQNFTINTNTLPIGLNSFRIKIITYKADNTIDRIQWSEPYKIPTCDTPTVLVQSEYKNIDCIPHFYGTPDPFLAASNPPPINYQPILYRASLRVIAEVYLENVSTEITQNENNRVIAQTQKETYVLQALGTLPPYAVSMLKSALYGDSLTIDNLGYVNPSEINKNNEGARSFFPNISIEKICKNNNKICN